MTDEISVVSRTQTIIIEPTSGAVSVINAGPPGPSGLAGTDGLWDNPSGDLQPITNPDNFFVFATTEIVLQTSDGSNIDISPPGDLTMVLQNDLNVSVDRDVNIDGPNNVNIQSIGGVNQDINFNAGRDIRIDGGQIDQVAIKARNTPAIDTRINNETIVFYLDQATNTLKVRVRYSNGTYKTGTVALT